MFPIESLKPVIIYNEFLGRLTDQFPKLFSSRMDHMQTDDLMHGRLYAKNYIDKVKDKEDNILYKYPFVLNSDGKIKRVEPRLDILKGFKPRNNLINNEWISQTDIYNIIPGKETLQTPEEKELTKKIVEKYSELANTKIESILFWNRLRPDEMFEAWWDRYYCTDPFFRSPDGAIDFADCEVLKEMNHNSELFKGYWVPPADCCDRFSKERISWDDFKEYVNKDLTRNDAKANKIWNILAKKKNQLLSNYVDEVYMLSEEEKNMGIYVYGIELLSRMGLKDTVIGVWLIDCIKHNSDAISYDPIDIVRNLIVGINREALDVHNKLEGRIKEVLKGL